MIQHREEAVVPVLDREIVERADRQASWRGRSGRIYALRPEPPATFRFVDDRLYLVALGPMVLWVGSALDIVADADSRARFRLAMDCADRVFEVLGTGSDIERLTVIWDLEAGEPLLNLHAA
jgi:hypothetical protein